MLALVDDDLNLIGEFREGAWIKCLTEVERIRAGERAAPTIQELLEELPPLTLPAA